VRNCDYETRQLITVLYCLIALIECKCHVIKIIYCADGGWGLVRDVDLMMMIDDIDDINPAHKSS